MTGTPATVRSSYVRDGLAGVDDTLRMMRALILKGKVNPLVRQFTARLVNTLPQRAYVSEARAVHDFVRDHIRYTKDPHDVEMLHAPEFILQNNYGDCDDKTILFCSMMESIGHPCKLVAVGQQPNMCSHVYAETLIGKRWYPSDTCEPWELGQAPAGILCRRTLRV